MDHLQENRSHHKKLLATFPLHQMYLKYKVPKKDNFYNEYSDLLQLIFQNVNKLQ